MARWGSDQSKGTSRTRKMRRRVSKTRRRVEVRPLLALPERILEHLLDQLLQQLLDHLLQHPGRCSRLPPTTRARRSRRTHDDGAYTRYTIYEPCAHAI